MITRRRPLSIFSLVALACALLFYATPATADRSSAVTPSLTAPIVDTANIISSEVEERLNRGLRALYSAGGSQVAVLTLPDLAEESIEGVSIRVAEAWKLGSKTKENGVLLTIAVAQHQMRIEVGGGIEGELTDLNSKRIIDEVMVPEFRAGRFSEGVFQGVLAIVQRTDPTRDLAQLFGRSVRAPRHRGQPVSLLFLIMLFIPILFFLSRVRHLGGRGPRGGAFYGGGWYGGGSMGGVSGGRGSFGGFSGGGGGFSGGGASGGW